MVDVDVLIEDSERAESAALGGEVLFPGRDAGVSDELACSVAFRAPSPGFFSGRSYGNRRSQHLYEIFFRAYAGERCTREGPAYGRPNASGRQSRRPDWTLMTYW